jgi:predicted RNA-binding Zn ribbon-like protein
VPKFRCQNLIAVTNAKSRHANPSRPTRLHKTDFRFNNAQLCFCFTATLGDRGGDGYERLSSPADLARWCVQAGLCAIEPEVTDTLFAAALLLREAIYRCAVAAAHRTNFLASDREIVNRWSAKPSLAPQLGSRSGTSVQWHKAETVEQALTFVARDAVDLLTSAWAERIRICENPLCAGLFADLSRPGRRRWCAMNTCGNLAKKQALHRRRPTNRSKRGDTGGRSHRRGSQRRLP